MTRFRAACVQMTSGADWRENIATAGEFAEDAKNQGANLILFPENVSVLDEDREKIRDSASPMDGHPVIAAFQEMAARLETWILAGTIPVAIGRDGAGQQQTVARSCLIDASGALVAHYDKIHMFDVTLADGESYRESATVHAGDTAVVAPTPWGGLGMTVCYDLRFPHLYRDLAKAGADFLAIPAAFTRPTGAAHWDVLLRARAIECGAYVFAPAQCGVHPGGRKTWGHGMIIDPWGKVIAQAGEEPELLLAEIEPQSTKAARDRIPALRHDRAYSGPSAA
ncbi:MAG: carbon-nitrogen hydrolase family protein [Magnetospiraceae bacterium]